MDRLSWKPTISLLFNFMTNNYDDYISIKLPLTWSEIPWLSPDLKEIFFPDNFLPCGNHVLTFKMFLGKKFQSKEFWSVLLYTCRFAFQITFVLFAWKIKGEIENNIEMKSHLGP